MKLTKCPDCGRTWAWVSEQAVAVKLVGHCIVCHSKVEGGYTSLDVRELILRLDEDGIITESKRREKSAGYGIESCHHCLRVRDPNCTNCKGVGFIKVTMH